MLSALTKFNQPWDQISREEVRTNTKSLRTAFEDLSMFFAEGSDANCSDAEGSDNKQKITEMSDAVLAALEVCEEYKANEDWIEAKLAVPSDENAESVSIDGEWMAINVGDASARPISSEKRAQ